MVIWANVPRFTPHMYSGMFVLMNGADNATVLHMSTHRDGPRRRRRIGAGRLVNVSVTLPAPVLQEADTAAEAHRIARGAILRRAIELGLRRAIAEAAKEHAADTAQR